MKGAFISGTGTGVGKTFVTRGLAAALRSRGEHVAALKPIETGFGDPAQSDAHALAHACGHPELRDQPGFYRAPPPLAPWAATLEGHPACPPLASLVRDIVAAGQGADTVLVEGAGGLFVPLDARHTTADLIHALGLSLVLVAPDQLGVLSHALTAFDCAERRGLRVLAFVLVAPADDVRDPSVATNRRILLERLPVPVISFPRVRDDDTELAEAAVAGGLVHLVRSVRSPV